MRLGLSMLIRTNLKKFASNYCLHGPVEMKVRYRITKSKIRCSNLGEYKRKQIF